MEMVWGSDSSSSSMKARRRVAAEMFNGDWRQRHRLVHHHCQTEAQDIEKKSEEELASAFGMMLSEEPVLPSTSKWNSRTPVLQSASRCAACHEVANMSCQEVANMSYHAFEDLVARIRIGAPPTVRSWTRKRERSRIGRIPRSSG